MGSFVSFFFCNVAYKYVVVKNDFLYVGTIFRLYFIVRGIQQIVFYC